jgi:hypothetical protein
MLTRLLRRFPMFFRRSEPEAGAGTEEVQEEVDEESPEEEVEVEIDTLPEAVPATPSGNADLRKRYIETARKLGFEPVELIREEILAFCAEQDIPLYPNEDVARYLDEQRNRYGSYGDMWRWRPLREQDIVADLEFGLSEDEQLQDGYYSADPDLDDEMDRCPPYDRLVPLRVLERVLALEEAFDGRVAFFVAWHPDEMERTYIMVRPRRGDPSLEDPQHLVFDTWCDNGLSDDEDTEPDHDLNKVEC